MEERAYDAVETIDAYELERRVLVTLQRLQPMRDQAMRINAFNKEGEIIAPWIYNRNRNGNTFKVSDLLQIEELLMNVGPWLQGGATTTLRLSDNDRVVFSQNRYWALHWIQHETQIKNILAVESLAVRVRHLASVAFLLEWLAQAPKSAGYNSVIPALTRAVASKFAFDCAIQDYNKLMDLSDGMPLLMYHRDKDDEAIVEINDPVAFQTHIKFYNTHTAYTRQYGGDIGHLSTPVVLLEEADVSSIDDVTLTYVTENYPFIPESVQNLIRYRPGEEGFLEAYRDFQKSMS